LEFAICAADIKQNTQVIKWNIKSEDYDVGFHLTFKSEEQKSVVDKVEYRRVNSHVQAFEGSFACEIPGTYAVILDNSYSKRRKKIVLHNVCQTEVSRY